MFQNQDVIAKPLAERKAMQQEHGTTQLPLQDLCYATYTTLDGEQIIVDLIGTDEGEQIALLSYLDETTGKRAIWIAQRDQAGAPSTWLWTAEQMKAAQHNHTRIDDTENDFADDAQAESTIQVAPLIKDRRTEILMLGQVLGKSDAEIQEQLRAEGLDDRLRKTEPIQVQQRPHKKLSGKKQRRR